jgi:asparagine synthase (glutamine-hydrolysing)
MRGRFLMVARNDPLPQARDQNAPANLQCVFDRGHVKVFVGSDLKCFLLPERRGAIIGSLFRRSDSQDAGEVDLSGAANLEAVDLVQWLMNNFWGSWCAVIIDRAGESWSVARDPSPGRPVYFMQADRETVVASHPQLIYARVQALPQIDWGFIWGHLASSNLRPARTGLVGVTEILAGQRLCHNDDSNEIELAWTPWRAAGRDRIIWRRKEAIEMLRQTTLDCVGAWARGQQHIVLGVSGGLDSSIVAACLKHSSANFSCLTMATGDGAGDERIYARELVKHLDIPLHEGFESLGDVDVMRSSALHLPRPIARSFAQSSDLNFRRVAEMDGASAFMNGGGGDNVFCLLNSAAPIADAFLCGAYRHGIKASLDVARQTEVSVFTAFSAGLRKAVRRDRSYRLKGTERFLVPASRDFARADHPWLHGPGDLLPGRAMHIAWLLGIENHLEGFDRERGRPVISPLMSQPLVELCLRIPTWDWCAGGINRSAARDAFANDLPRSIVRRRGKGTPTSFALELFEHNQGTIRDMVLGGALAAHGVLDRAAIEAWFANSPPWNANDKLRILQFVDVEAWVRAWSAGGALES